MNYIPTPGDLCKYMSRTLLVISDPYTNDTCPNNWVEQWVDTIEIDDSTHRKVRCSSLTLIQKTEESNNVERAS